MKKFGFTLVECLLALAIVGIIAAVTLPAIKHSLPDKDKIAVLKTNKIIMDINEDILSNKRWTAYGEENCVGLQCINLSNPSFFILGQEYDDILIDATAKSFPYPVIFARHLQLNGDVTAKAIENGLVEFDTIDGNHWTISLLDNAGEFIITVDLMDSKKARCTYDKTSCTAPGQFSFYVDKQGKLYGNDPLTSAFLEHTDKLNYDEDDYNKAKKDTTTYKSSKKSTTTNE